MDDSQLNRLLYGSEEVSHNVNWSNEGERAKNGENITAEEREERVELSEEEGEEWLHVEEEEEDEVDDIVSKFLKFDKIEFDDEGLPVGCGMFCFQDGETEHRWEDLS